MKYIKPFDSVNEASELIKLGIPKEMAKVIHTMAGGKQTTQPFVLQSGKKLDRGVDFEESPVSHDIKVNQVIEKRKSYDNSILDYLDSIGAGQKVNMLLVSPDKSYMHYIMYKSQSVQHATKGNQYRVVTIDKSTGKPISKWAGTNGQLAGSAPIGTKLYIFEQENRASKKKEKREKLQNYTEKEFIDYVIENYSKLIGKAFGKYRKTAEEKFYKKLTGLSIEDIINTLSKTKGQRGSTQYTAIIGKQTGWSASEEDIKKHGESWEKIGELLDLADAVKRDVVDEQQLLNELNNFKKYMFSNGSYKPEKNNEESADLNDIIKSESLLGATTKFLQFVTYGKAYTSKNLYNQFFI